MNNNNEISKRSRRERTKKNTMKYQPLCRVIVAQIQQFMQNLRCDDLNAAWFLAQSISLFKVVSTVHFLCMQFELLLIPVANLSQGAIERILLFLHLLFISMIPSTCHYPPTCATYTRLQQCIHKHICDAYLLCIV